MSKLQDFLNSPVSHVSGCRAPKAGDFYGIEIECEGRNVNWGGGDENLLNNWRPERDGSLRDFHGPPQEWVFNGPVKYKASKARIDQLFDYFDKRKAKIVCSNRTSVHVHFNVGDKTAYQVVNLFILFTILEDLMDRYCGEDRDGNLFCLSSRRAEEQINWMMNAVFKTRSFTSFRNDFRYCSLNMASVNKFGSIEFRGMRGLDNRQDLHDWFDIVQEFCEYGCYKMHNPVDLIQEISYKTPVGFVKEVFSDRSFKLLTEGLDEDVINDSIYEGLRLVQMMCYKIGTEFDQVRLRGKDFWNSFAEDDEDPKPEVDPKKIQQREDPLLRVAEVPPLLRPKQRRGVGFAKKRRQRANPFNANFDEDDIQRMREVNELLRNNPFIIRNEGDGNNA